MEDEEVKVDQSVRARDVKDGAVLPLVWEIPEMMSYLRQSSRFLGAQRVGALPIHERAPKVMYAGRSSTTVYGTWQLR